MRQRCLIEDKCSICGTKLLPVRWFAGGPLSAFHPHGSYIDPPLHRDCLHYALKVCPWLALPSYTKGLELRTLREPHPEMLFVDNTMIADKPVVFVCVGADGQSVKHQPEPLPTYIRPNRPYRAVEFWKDGRQLPEPEALRLIKADAIAKVANSQPSSHVQEGDNSSKEADHAGQ